MGTSTASSIAVGSVIGVGMAKTDTRRKDVVWNTGDAGQHPTWDGAKLAVLMDIRDELKQLNGLLNCPSFISIPRKLDAIQRNTAKPRKVVKK